MRRDRGTATLEMALVLPVLVALVALVAPLAVLFVARVELGQAGGDLVRLATSRSDVARVLGPITVPAGELPDATALEAEALRFGGGRPITLSGPPARTPDLDCPSTWRLTLTVTTTVDLGPAGAAFAGLTGTDATKTLTATASSCEE